MLAKESSDRPALRRREDASPAELSFAQQRLWFLDQLDPHKSFYNLSAAVQLAGAVEADILGQALNQIVRRHESLRTRFVTVDGKPRQEILEDRLLQLEFHDLSGGQNAAELAKRFAQQPFDLSTDHLLRAALIRVSPSDHTLVIVLHHIISDGWSMGILQRELAECYRAVLASEPPRLDPLDFQYADFAVWQREWLSEEVLERHLEYWREKLGSDHSPLQLPTDHVRPTSPSHRGGRAKVTVSPQLKQRLDALAKDENATLFMVLLAAWKIVLSRNSGQSRIRVGSPVANRRSVEVEPLVGFFVNTLVLQTEVSLQQTFRELLANIRRTTLEAVDHQDVPFDRLVDDLQVDRDLRYAPLVQTLFVLQNTPKHEVPLNTFQVVDVDLAINDSSDYDLTLNVTPTKGTPTPVTPTPTTPSQGEVELMLVYAAELFESETAGRWLESLITVLETIVDSPESVVGDIPVVGPRQRKLLVERWNDTACELATHLSVHELIARRCVDISDVPAVEMEGQRVSYGDLNRRSNQLAHHLCRLGVAADQPVAICLPRSPQAIVAMLAVLKAGAAYLPIDPTFPESRVRFMLNDSGATILVTRDGSVPAAADDRLLVNLDELATSLGELPVDCPDVTVKPDNLAYTIYTSGSTGQPKAVAVMHRGLSNHLQTMAPRFGLDIGDRRGQFLSLSFDASVEEILPALYSGATLVMHPSPQELTCAEIRRFCLANQIRAITLLPAVFNPMVESLEIESSEIGGSEWLDQLKTVIIGGDRVPPGTMRRWGELCGDHVRTLFLFGVTEATITSTVYELPRHYESQLPIPIGKPIANHRTYVLDDRMNLVPVGAVGHLYIGGIGVARGYLNRQELSADRFVDDPYSGGATNRLYRTGDLARWRTDGNLEFVGRSDDQLKIRGYRIEAGEIEQALVATGELLMAKVVARNDARGHKQIVAYVVPKANHQPTSDQLLDDISRQLPSYMAPAAVILLEKFPIAPGGKIDVDALPEPQFSNTKEQHQHVAPRNQREQAMAEVWQQLLGVKRVGIHDNFFQLGGDSILSLQMVSRALAAGFRVTPKQLFLHQTVAELATVAEDFIECQPDLDTNGRCTLSPIQRQFFASELPRPHHFSQAVLLKISDRLTSEHLFNAWSAVREQHPVLDSCFETADGQWQHCFDRVAHENTGFENCELNEDAGDHQQQIQENASRLMAGFDIHSGTLARAILFNSEVSADRRLLLAAHHLVVDGVSWRIIVEDFELACQAQLRGQSINLPPRTNSSGRWIRAIELAANDPDTRAARQYWQDWPTAPELPAASTTAANTHGQSRTIVRQLNADRTTKLLAEAQRAYRTKVDEFLLAALAAAVNGWTGSKELRVDIERHGRDLGTAHGDWSRTVGWFTAATPVRLNLSQCDDAIDMLKSTKDQLRSVPGCDATFGMLRWIAEDDQIVKQFPRGFGSDISFNYLGRLDASTSEASLVTLAEATTGKWVADDNPRWHLLDVISMVTDGELRIQIVYSPNHFSEPVVNQLADRFLDQLGQLITDCSSPSAGGFTATDFPQLEIASAEVRQLEDSLCQLAPVRDITDISPLTPAQQLMLMHWQATDTDVMCEQFRCRLQGDLDVQQLQLAWNEILRRHAVLRTAIVADVLDEPVQFVVRGAELPWSVHDLRDLTTDQQSDETSIISRRDQRDSFQLNHAPLMRVTLLQLADDQWQMIWTVHHLISDGWSAAIILQELFSMVGSLAEGAAPSLLPCPDFTTYVGWLKTQHQGDAESFWKDKLRGLTATKIAGDNHSSISSVFQEHEIHFDADEKRRLDDFCTVERLTLGCLLTSAWALVLARQLGRDDVVFGVTVSGRPTDLPHAESIVGPFANNIPYRTRIRGDETVGQWLRQNLGWQLEAQPFEHTPLHEIATWCSATGGRFFDCLLVIENYPLSDGRRVNDRLVVSDIHGTATSGLPLTVIVFPGRELTIRLRYETGALDAPNVLDLAGQLSEALRELTRSADSRLVDLPMLAGWQSVTRQVQERLPAVTAHLTDHPLVTDWHVVRWSDADGEPGFAVYIVPTADSLTILDDGQSLVAARVRQSLIDLPETSGMALSVVVLYELPRGDGGAIVEDELPPPVRPRPADAPAFVAPRDEIEQTLADIWSELLGIHPIGIRDQFMAFGGYSSLAVNLIARIEEELDRRVPLVALFQDPTVEYLADLVRRPRAELEENTLVPIRPHGSRPPLFCIHPAGGTVFCYLNLANQLSADQPVYGLQAVGVDGRRAPQTEVTEMAAHYVHAIRQQQPTEPYAICGWSSGGIIAFEVARQLKAAGAEIKLLLLFDAAIRASREYSQEDFLPMLLMMFPGESRDRLEELQSRSFVEQLEYFRNRAATANLVVAGAENSQIKNVYDVFQANVNAMSTYRPQTFDGTLTLLRASDHATPMHEDPYLGWQGLASDIQVLEIAGDHVTMFNEPDVKDLAKQVEELL